MHQRQALAFCPAGCGQAGGCLRTLTGEQDGVLRIPPVDAGCGPQVRAEAVKAGEPVRPEQDRPELRPLLVDVLRAELERHCGGEQHDVAQRTQFGHQGRRTLEWQVFGDFHADDQVELGVRLGTQHIRQAL